MKVPATQAAGTFSRVRTDHEDPPACLSRDDNSREGKLRGGCRNFLFATATCYCSTTLALLSIISGKTCSPHARRRFGS